MCIYSIRRSQWPRSLRRRSAAACLLRSWVRIPQEAWRFVCCECCVLSGRGLCDELITRPEESYRLWCVVVCDLETSRVGAPYIYDISSLRVNWTLLMSKDVAMGVGYVINLPRSVERQKKHSATLQAYKIQERPPPPLPPSVQKLSAFRLLTEKSNIKIHNTLILESRNSVDVQWLGYDLNILKSVVPFPAVARIFSLLLTAQTFPGFYSASFSVGSKVSCWAAMRLGHETDYCPKSGVEIRHEWSQTSTPPYIFVAFIRTKSL